MPDREKDLETILEDVRTIKNILQNTDAPLPPVWHLLYYVAVPALVLIALVKFFVPLAAALPFLDTFLWVWLPTLSVMAVIISFQVARLLKKTGTRFMAQSRVQVFLYTRFVLAPAILTAGYLLSLNPAYSMDGAMAVLFAAGMTQIVVLMPRQFRVLPFVYLFGGWIELALGLGGPVWTLINTLSAAVAVFFIASWLKQGESPVEAQHA